MIPGIAALLLIRGCPEHRLDECFELMYALPAPTTIGQALRDVDAAIAKLGAIDAIE